jgi:hypothetical protein
LGRIVSREGIMSKRAAIYVRVSMAKMRRKGIRPIGYSVPL